MAPSNAYANSEAHAFQLPKIWSETIMTGNILQPCQILICF